MCDMLLKVGWRKHVYWATCGDEASHQWKKGVFEEAGFSLRKFSLNKINGTHILDISHHQIITDLHRVFRILKYGFLPLYPINSKGVLKINNGNHSLNT